MVIGEAPGRDEDEGGEPFIGRSGRLLFQLIHRRGRTRSRRVLRDQRREVSSAGESNADARRTDCLSAVAERAVPRRSPPLVLAFGQHGGAFGLRLRAGHRRDPRTHRDAGRRTRVWRRIIRPPHCVADRASSTSCAPTFGSSRPSWQRHELATVLRDGRGHHRRRGGRSRRCCQTATSSCSPGPSAPARPPS